MNCLSYKLPKLSIEAIILFCFSLIFCPLDAATSYITPLSTEWIKDFEEYVENERIHWGVPGIAIAIVHGKNIVALRGFGTRGLSDQRPVEPDTLFQIGSLSKAFTSALVAQGVDKGLVKWTDHVKQLFPRFQLADKEGEKQFEIADLLCQRSGLYQHVGDMQALVGFPIDVVIRSLPLYTPKTPFRSAFAYQNIFFVIAADILKIKTGLDYSDLLQKWLFDPLEMHQSNVGTNNYIASPNRVQWHHRTQEGKITPIPDDFKERYWTDTLAPAGAINSTAADLANWLLFQLNEGTFHHKSLLSPEEMRKMHAPWTSMGEKDGVPLFYGLGWVRNEDKEHPLVWHDGATLGVYNYLAMSPENRLGIVVLTNVRDAPLAMALGRQFFDLYFGKQGMNWSRTLWEKATPKPKTFTPNYWGKTTMWKPLQGTYTHPLFGSVQVKATHQGLKLKIGPLPSEMNLIPIGPDRFMVDWPYVDQGTSTVSFQDKLQKALQVFGQPIPTFPKSYIMNVEMVNEEGGGPFLRK